MTLLTALRLLPFTLLILLAGWIGARVRDDRLAWLRRLPDSRLAPLAAGVVTSLAILFVWGSIRQIPMVHDEASYLLQAETFARGRWTMPSPPIPAFFEQFHVFVTPTYASKYMPGHGILLVPGIWLGLPGLVPTILNGLAAALLFILVRCVANGWVATLTVALWLPMPSNIGFRSGYFSESTSSVLWLGGWLALMRWKETKRDRWLLLVAFCVGWMAITRPLTAVAYAIPVGAVVLHRVSQRRQWTSLLRPALLGIAILAVLPVWNAKTTGNWRVSPYSLYSKVYFPFDDLGFGFDTTPPRRALPGDMQKFTEAFGKIHAAYTVDRVPHAFYVRWRSLFTDAFGKLRVAFVPFAVLALLVIPAAGWFAIAGSVMLTLSYLVYAHPSSWTLYYEDIFPLFPYLTATGLWAAWTWLIERSRKTSALDAAIDPTATARRAALAGALVTAFLLIFVRADLIRLRGQLARLRAAQEFFGQVVSELPEPRTIVFIRYSPRHNMNTSLIANHADLAGARTWFVYDRGPENNAKLEALAPDRTPYLFDEDAKTLVRLTPDHPPN